MSSENSMGNQCHCCNQVLEELTQMKNDFQKYFDYFIKQFELFKEVFEVHNMRGQQDTNQLQSSTKSVKVHQQSTQRLVAGVKRQRQTEKRRKITENQKTSASEDTEKEDEESDDEGELDQNKKLQEIQKRKILRASTASNDDEEWVNSSEPESCSTEQSYARARVLPMHPFQSIEDFELWNEELSNRKTLRMLLHDELLEGHFIDANYYIRNIWKCIFPDEIATCFSMHGNAKTNKKALKDYIFTSIFQDCFVERYPNAGSSCFIRRTTYLFNYVTDRARRVANNSQEISMDIEFV